MKRLIWLLALLYCWTVAVDTSPFRYVCGELDDYSYHESCYTTKDVCEDYAAALNEAHERRKRPPMWYVLPPDVIKRSSTTFHLYDDMLPAGGFYK